MGKMVETITYNINDLERKSHDEFINVINVTDDIDFCSRNLSAESEFHRILVHLGGNDLEINKRGYQIIPYYFTLDVGKNVQRYKTLIEHNGELMINRNGNDKKYVSTFCGAGHSRTQKNLFVDADIIDSLNDILLCGMDKSMIYSRPSKWNAYYAMVTTDSTPVDYMPNIVVVDDCKKSVCELVDVVQLTDDNGGKGYAVADPEEREIEILPFDGAGLVTPQCAAKWSLQLNIRNKAGKRYIPGSFQFRAIPGIKGVVNTFDLRQFAKEHGVSKIIDLGGREWDIFEDQIDVVLTKSQFKFWDKYLDEAGMFDCQKWRKAFDQKTHGYQRTFNIVTYSPHSDDLRKTTMLSYQPLQTLSFTDNEIMQLSQRGLQLYEDITTDLDKFLKYRQLITDDGEIADDDTVPPYYVALCHNRDLYHDPYVHSKMSEDVKKMRNNLLSGKQFVHGNYQFFIPDLYGLAEYIFQIPVNGLLRQPYHIYSYWWNCQNKSEVDIIRNPHIGMEHRIGLLQNSDEIQKWYKYQTTGIITSMYDTLALALNGADYDGDTIVTSDSPYLINAVKREIASGNGHIVVKDDLRTIATSDRKGISIADRSSLMRVNAMSFKNSIGKVIDRITDLWSLLSTDPQRIRNYIKIGTIVGAETIDFAKTGENAELPKEITQFLQKKKKGHWMRYLQKFNGKANAESARKKTADKLKVPDNEMEDCKKFTKYDCTMDHLCSYAEKRIAAIDQRNQRIVEISPFDYHVLLLSSPAINRDVMKKLRELQKKYKNDMDSYRIESAKSKTHKKYAVNRLRWFYDECRVELLALEQDVNKLLDMLLLIYYGEADRCKSFISCSKDILWNAFPEEMIQRSQGRRAKDIDFSKLEERHRKNIEYAKKEKAKRVAKKSVLIQDIPEREVIITAEDRKMIKDLVQKWYDEKSISRKDNIWKVQRVFTMLVFLGRKYEKIETVDRTIRENGHYVKNPDGTNMTEKVFKYSPRWFVRYNNVPEQLTNNVIRKLTGVSDGYIDDILCLLRDKEILQIKVVSGGKLKMKILFEHTGNTPWIVENDCNKAGTKVRDYFRK